MTSDKAYCERPKSGVFHHLPSYYWAFQLLKFFPHIASLQH